MIRRKLFNMPRKPVEHQHLLPEMERIEAIARLKETELVISIHDDLIKKEKMVPVKRMWRSPMLTNLYAALLDLRQYKANLEATIRRTT